MKTAAFLLAVVLIFVFLAPPVNAQPNPLAAFPGAEGFGAVTTGGRGGQVIYVTTLAPNGPGSLAEALATPGPRTIVFAVSGLINAAAEIIYGDVTIAGQTSPSGIIVRGIVCDGHFDLNNCDNLIIRHIRSRPAIHLGTDGAGYILDDALRLDGMENAIIDHVSLENASDEALQISMARNVTIQNSILGETIGEHHVFGGLLINYSHRQRPLDNLSIHHNLWYRITGRLPEITCELSNIPGHSAVAEIPSFCSQQPLNVEVSDNLLWDAGGPLTFRDNLDDTRGQPQAGIFTLNMNWVNNYMVVTDSYTMGMMGSTFISQPGNRLFFSGNRMSIYPDYVDTQLVYCCNDFNLYNPSDETPAAQLLTEPHAFPTITHTATEALTDYMIAQVGAFPRDPMDARYIDSLRSGIIPDVSHEQAVADDAFTLSFTEPPAPPLDADLDGMPDEWETANGLDPNTQDHNGTELSVQFTGVEGYTNLEVYLNWLADQLVQNVQ